MKSSASQLFRCYAPSASWRDGEISLSSDETHHLVNVLRHEPGDEVRVFNGEGREVVAVLGETGETGCACLRILREIETVPCALKIELVQAIPKKGRMEMVLQKATELGVSAIQPVLTERTIVRLDENKRIKKERRWRKILVGAAKQCKIAAVPELRSICSFDQFLAAREPSSPMLICSLEEHARPLGDVLANLTGASSVTILVGPEGDFTEREYSAARDARAFPVSLGDRVLRTDTATVYMLSVLNYVFGS